MCLAHHKILGCYGVSLASLIQVDIAHNDDVSVFIDSCFQATHEQGNTGFGIMVYCMKLNHHIANPVLMS